MNKTINRGIRAGLAFVLALVMCLCIGGASAVFATGSTQPALGGDEAAITKVLKVPYGTEYPAMDFTFTIDKISWNDSTATADVNKLPDVPASPATAGEVVISFDGAAAATPAETLDGTTAGITTYYLESSDIFDSVVWPETGIYEYYITETTYSPTIALGDLHESLTLSLAEYKVFVYINECDGGTLCTQSHTHSVGLLYIEAIGVIKVVDDDGTPDATGDKSDPTPGGNGTSFFYSQMAFTNNYVKTNGPVDPDDPDPKVPAESTLNVSKEVTGSYGSTTAYFDFSLKLTLPSIIDSSYVLPYYKAYVIEETSTAGVYAVIDPTANVASASVAALIGQDATANAYKFIKFVPSTATAVTTAFTLKHGQQLVFVNTPVGTVYDVTETAVSGYDTTITLTYDGGSPASLIKNVMTATDYVGEDFTAADYVNDFDVTSPTGLDISDLPFIGLIVVAIGAIAAWILVKSRKRRSYN